MRLLVLRLLLLAVFFNTAIGMPLHGATHIRQAVAGPAQAFVGLNGCEDDALTGQAGQRGQAGEKAEVVETAEAVCAWCMGHAPHAAAWLPHFGLPLAVAAPPERVPPRTVGGAIPSQNRWAFASRDPPR
ncbi:DUF2946 family protein [Delftia acidovorans]|uniref:DUF2946 family protein n=1 Tax=Delftia acidovorans TaxID=80866 RepID=UPI0018D7C83B|nr:DUF2946 family protein [Delftia acidovorans]QPR34280.1 DUF2946 family protein [Delftia acidovorans]